MNVTRYSPESLFFKPARDGSRKVKTVRDWISANITLQKGVVGAKPLEFCGWLFELLGMNSDDNLHDLYPGTGIVTSSWEIWRENQKRFE